MTKSDLILTILGNKLNQLPSSAPITVFAPTNIALCKYWGKRSQELNLPVTSSLSISLGKKGTTTELMISDTPYDIIVSNHTLVDSNSHFYKRLVAFLDLFPWHHRLRFHINTTSNIPVAAGLASSASGFAAITMALNQLFDWQLSHQELSLIARLGSGSACRSIWSGFVEWHAGIQSDGMDSYGVPLEEKWPNLCIGLVIISNQEKHLSSRDAMQHTLETSRFYTIWPDIVNHDLMLLKQAIKHNDMVLLGKVAESNAMAMHATMLSAWPPISYALPETILTMKKVWLLRQQGLPLYFTQDAGSNLKLLFSNEHQELVRSHFPSIEILQPFS